MVDERLHVRGGCWVVVTREGGVAVAMAAQVKRCNLEALGYERRHGIAVNAAQLAHAGHADHQRPVPGHLVGNPSAVAVQELHPGAPAFDWSCAHTIPFRGFGF